MTDPHWEETRRKVLGLGEKSQQKSYFPTLKRRLKELEQLRAALDSSSDAIFWAELPSWRLLEMNAAARRMVAGTEMSGTGPQLSEFFPADIWARIMQPAGSGLPGLEGKLVTEISGSEGSSTSVELSIDSIEIDNQHLAIIVARDITERLALEAKLYQAQKLEALGVLAGGIAHDFNNVLFVILGNADMARSQLVNSVACEHSGTLSSNIGEIRSAAERGADLVKQILTFARKAERVRQPIDVLPLISESTKMMRSVIPATIRMETDYDLTDNWICADPTEIHQIMMNLCTNASHAMADGGGVLAITAREVTYSVLPPELELAGGEEDRYVCLQIRDSGSGIPANVLPRIFEPFFSTKGVGQGTGMGLSVVHGVITSLGGGVTVASRPGQGTVFSVYLPSVTGHQATLEVETRQLPHGDERVLIVDDEQAITKFQEKALSTLEYRVTVSNSSQEVLELIRADPEGFDLLITDQTMPGLSGTELATQVRTISPELPIILCTGFSQLVSIENAAEFGITEFLEKPLTIEVLATAIRRVLDGS